MVTLSLLANNQIEAGSSMRLVLYTNDNLLHLCVILFNYSLQTSFMGLMFKASELDMLCVAISCYA